MTVGMTGPAVMATGSGTRSQVWKKPVRNSSVSTRQTRPASRPATVMPGRRAGPLAPSAQGPGPKDDGDEAQQQRRRAQHAQDQPNDAEGERGHPRVYLHLGARRADPPRG
jgi:hypothetical protein